MALLKEGRPAWLVLANGQVLEGRSFGAQGTVFGEVVFSTGMVGYQENLTDPCYYGQILTQTFPSVGNYGVNDADLESADAHVSGYIVREWCNAPSNFRMTDTLESFMKAYSIVGLYNIDTRRLTRMLRDQGVMNGAITTTNPQEHMEELLTQIRAYTVQDAVDSVTCDAMQQLVPEETKYRVVYCDFGGKRSLRETFLAYGCEVMQVPANTAASEILALQPDGIVLSDGPGNPAENEAIIENIKALTESGIPMFGIGLGHQLLALAMGGKTEKLKYGHRGANQPVIDLESGRTYVTTQNYGYAVQAESLDSTLAAVTHVNANDKTCEGIAYRTVPAFSVQFYPEMHGGALDTAYLFEKFVTMMQKGVQ